MNSRLAGLDCRVHDEHEGTAVLEVLCNMRPAAPSFPIEGVRHVPRCGRRLGIAGYAGVAC